MSSVKSGRLLSIISVGKESIFRRAGTMAVQTGRPPHCYSVRSVCSVLAIICLAKNISRVVLKLASTSPMIRSWWILRALVDFACASYLFKHDVDALCPADMFESNSQTGGASL